MCLHTSSKVARVVDRVCAYGLLAGLFLIVLGGVVALSGLMVRAITGLTSSDVPSIENAASHLAMTGLLMSIASVVLAIISERLDRWPFFRRACSFMYIMYSGVCTTSLRSVKAKGPHYFLYRTAMLGIGLGLSTAALFLVLADGGVMWLHDLFAENRSKILRRVGCNGVCHDTHESFILDIWGLVFAHDKRPTTGDPV